MSAPAFLHAPPAKLSLEEDEIHVWRAHLGLDRERLERLAKTLSSDEQTRAARFHFARDRDHYIAGRGLLRSILGNYLATEPGQLRFSYNPYGKPELQSPANSGALQFNLAHSRGLALYAFTRRRQIGIDVEMIRPDFATEEIAARFFSPAEIAVLRALPREVQPVAFFNCWTRKEAFIKARGMGLSLPLDQFVVAFAPGESPALVSAADDPQAAEHWAIAALEPGNGYAAALAVEGRNWKLKCWDGLEGTV